MAKEQKKNIAVTVDNLHITYRGLKKFEVEEAEAGDIIEISGITDINIGDTIIFQKEPE